MKKSKKYSGITVAVIIVTIAACSPVFYPTYSDYDRGVDFNSYKSFAWLPDKDSASNPYDNQIIRNNTQNYFTHCFGERGYKLNLDTPDVLMQLVVNSEKKSYTVTSPSYPYSHYSYSNPYYYPYGSYYYYRGPSYSNYYGYSYWNNYTTTKKVEYMKNSITVNVIDRKQNKLVWTATTEGDIYDPAYISENLHPAVYDLLDNYPITPIKEHKRPKN